MSAFERVLDGIREVLKATDEIKRLSEGVKSLSIEVRELDRRLIRLETMVEIAQAHAGKTTARRLPNPTRD